MSSDHKLVAIVLFLITVIIVSVGTTSMVKSYFALEAAKVKAAEGHKFKFGITKEDNNEAK